jgi:hypothetical protein
VNARLFAIVALFGALVACEETRGDFGDECLSDDDCLSNTCVGRACVNPPAVFTASDGGSSATTGDR